MSARRFLLMLACVAVLLPARAAEQFESILVNPQSFVSGQTHHGYREIRILVENRSSKDSHQVTLILPDRSFGYGNSIGRLSRTVALAPGTSAIVPMWQPPLSQNGNGQLRVLVDGRRVGSVGFTADSHAASGYSGTLIPATVLVSRSVKQSDLASRMHAESHAYSAIMATGPYDSGRRRGTVATAWTPDPSASGPHWLEVDFERPVVADRLRFYPTFTVSYTANVFLIGVSGSNYPPISISPVSHGTPGTPYEVPCAATEPIRSARFDFGHVYAGLISIDAVNIEGTDGKGPSWASAARASSELSSGSRGGSSGGTPANAFLRSELPVSEWSQSWLSYTPFDGVAISAAEFRSLPPGVQSALLHFTESGGNLMIFGQGTIPEPWRNAPTTSLPGGSVAEAGFGRCFAFASSDPTEVPAESIKAAMDSLLVTSRQWQMLPDEANANNAFPVVENARIPVRGIVIVMLAFVIAIGPVNIIYLTRTNRRTWLLWTIPAISLATSLAVFVYGMVREGFTSEVRTDTVTLLDQASRRASTIGMMAYYCPLTPGGGLMLSPEMEVTPLVQNWDWSHGTAREVDWSRGQHFGSGWIASRVPAHFLVRKAEMRRERVQLERDGNQLNLVNGLGAGIRKLWLADASGQVYTAEEIPAGQRRALEAVPTAKADPNAHLRAIGESVLSVSSEALRTNAMAYLRPGSYIAELDGDPFIEHGLERRGGSARWRPGATVYGLLETAAKP